VSTEEIEVRRCEQGGGRGSCVSHRSMRGDEARGGDKHQRSRGGHVEEAASSHGRRAPAEVSERAVR
jgi:hypothetical protein